MNGAMDGDWEERNRRINAAYAKPWVAEQRMRFVLRAADQFDKLLNGPQRSRVEESIRAIAAGEGVA